MHTTSDKLPLLDQKYLLQNFHEVGFSYLLPEILVLFREQSAIYLQSLETCLNQGDLKGLSTEAHSLKGAAGSVGAAALAEAAETIEDSAADTDHAAATALLTHLRTISKQTDEAIVTELEHLVSQQANEKKPS